MQLLEAQKRAAQIAMGDLYGTSEGDNYPFNAVAYRESHPQSMQRQVEEVIVYVYHHDEPPAWLNK